MLLKDGILFLRFDEIQIIHFFYTVRMLESASQKKAHAEAAATGREAGGYLIE